VRGKPEVVKAEEEDEGCWNEEANSSSKPKKKTAYHEKEIKWMKMI